MRRQCHLQFLGSIPAPPHKRAKHPVMVKVYTHVNKSLTFAERQRLTTTPKSGSRE